MNYKSISVDCYGRERLSGCPEDKENTVFVRFMKINKTVTQVCEHRFPLNITAF